MCTTQRELKSTGSGGHFRLMSPKTRFVPGCRLDLDQPWNLDTYLKGHVEDAVNVVGWALDKVIKECLGDPLSPRVLTQTIEQNVWNSTLKLSAALNSTPVQVVFDEKAHRVLPIALGNLVNGTWKVAGVYDPTAMNPTGPPGRFVERTHVITWPRTGKLVPKHWEECDQGQARFNILGKLPQCLDCPAGTSSLGNQATSCDVCAPGANLNPKSAPQCCKRLGYVAACCALYRACTVVNSIENRPSKALALRVR
jgi:hypothetical protein